MIINKLSVRTDWKPLGTESAAVSSNGRDTERAEGSGLRVSGRRGERSSAISETASQKRLCHLLLEEVLEGLAGVVRARRGSRGRRASLLRVRGRRGVFLHGGAEFVKRAVVLRVFG